MSIQERERELVNEFSMLDDWDARYEYIIELGRELPPMDEKLKTDANKIKGCQSQVWLHAEKKDGKLYFTADSDAIITKGIVALLIRIFSGATPLEIQSAGLTFIDEIGLTRHLSPTRSNGLLSMVKQMKYYSIALA